VLRLLQRLGCHAGRLRAAKPLCNQARQLLRWGHSIDAARIDGALRHGRKGRCVGLLRQAQASGAVQGLQACCAIVPHARQHHAHCALALVLGHGGQEHIDRLRRAAGFAGGLETQATALHTQLPPRGHHVNVVRGQHHAVVCIAHGQSRHALQQTAQQSFVFRAGVLHDHVGQARVAGDVRKKLLQSFQTTGRCADAHHAGAFVHRHGDVGIRQSEQSWRGSFGARYQSANRRGSSLSYSVLITW